MLSVIDTVAILYIHTNAIPYKSCSHGGSTSQVFLTLKRTGNQLNTVHLVQSIAIVKSSTNIGLCYGLVSIDFKIKKSAGENI